MCMYFRVPIYDHFWWPVKFVVSDLFIFILWNCIPWPHFLYVQVGPLIVNLTQGPLPWLPLSAHILYNNNKHTFLSESEYNLRVSIKLRFLIQLTAIHSNHLLLIFSYIEIFELRMTILIWFWMEQKNICCFFFFVFFVRLQLYW